MISFAPRSTSRVKPSLMFGCFDLQKSRFDKLEPPALTDPPGGFAYVIVGFLATAAVTDDEYRAAYLGRSCECLRHYFRTGAALSM